VKDDIETEVCAWI